MKAPRTPTIITVDDLRKERVPDGPVLLWYDTEMLRNLVASMPPAPGVGRFQPSLRFVPAPGGAVAIPQCGIGEMLCFDKGVIRCCPEPGGTDPGIDIELPPLPEVECWTVVNDDGTITCRKGAGCDGYCRKIYAYSCGSIVDVGCSCTAFRPTDLVIAAG